MNKQEILDKVVERLYDGKGQSSCPLSRGCLYRSPDGNKCAIGYLIPDELYDPAMDEMPDTDIGTVVDKFPSIREYLQIANYEDVIFLEKLQVAHDESIFWNGSMPNDKMNRCLQDIADEYGLNLNL